MSWKDILKEEKWGGAFASDDSGFPKEIMHDGIKYYVVEYIDDRSGQIGVYHTDDEKAPDQVLHYNLEEAKEKME